MECRAASSPGATGGTPVSPSTSPTFPGRASSVRRSVSSAASARISASAQDWDEAEMRAEAAEETERLTEEARPGKVGEVDGETGVPPVAPGEDAARHSIESEVAGPQVVLKIRRRQFKQQ